MCESVCASTKNQERGMIAWWMRGIESLTNIGDEQHCRNGFQAAARISQSQDLMSCSSLSALVCYVLLCPFHSIPFQLLLLLGGIEWRGGFFELVASRRLGRLPKKCFLLLFLTHSTSTSVLFLRFRFMSVLCTLMTVARMVLDDARRSAEGSPELYSPQLNWLECN